MKASDLKSFVFLESGDINYSEHEVIKSSNKLPPGSYTINYLEYPKPTVILKSDRDFETPKAHNFSDKEKIDIAFDSFFNKKISDKIESLGFCHKLGIFLYGIEGTGKSTIIKYYCNKAINEHNAIVFHLLYKRPQIIECWSFVQSIRRIQDNPIIIVFDEFDQHVHENEAFLKTVIDGNMSITNCIFLAATNYLEKIPKAMYERPSRFKYCLNIEGMQVKEDILQIINPILGDILNEKELNEIANDLKGNTLDYIKQYSFDRLMKISHFGKSKKTIGFVIKDQL